MSSTDSPLYLGFDLSTQQLKAVVVSSDLTVQFEAKVDFDADFKSKYGIHKGVKNLEDGAVVAPVAMWIESVDLVLQRLKAGGTPFERISGICGSGQQHGSVYWNSRGVQALQNLKDGRSLIEQLDGGFAIETSPNWQDATTQAECDEFDNILGDREQLADVTGSGAHHVSCFVLSFQCFRKFYSYCPVTNS
jgi:xylulokinase